MQYFMIVNSADSFEALCLKYLDAKGAILYTYAMRRYNVLPFSNQGRDRSFYYESTTRCVCNGSQLFDRNDILLIDIDVRGVALLLL